MSAIEFVGSFIEDWTKTKAAYRNILIAADIDDRKLAKFVRSANRDDIRVVSGADLKKSDDVDAIIANIEAHQLIIISGLEDIPEAALDTLALLLTERKIHVQAGDPPRDVAIDLPHFSLICMIDPGFPVSRVLYEMFEIKLLLGHDAQLPVAKDGASEEDLAEFGSALTHSHLSSQDFMVLSHEMPIILRIDSYLNENPEWYQTISYTPADAPGGTHAIFVDGANKELAKAIFDKFRWIGRFAIKHEGKVLFGGI